MRDFPIATVIAWFLSFLISMPVCAQQRAVEPQLAEVATEKVQVPTVTGEDSQPKGGAFYMRVEDSEGNQIEGSAEIAGEDGLIHVSQIRHEMSYGVDSESGDLIAPMRHGAFTVVKRADAASPLLFEALAGAETLREIVLTSHETGGDGHSRANYRIRLQKVKIRSIGTEGSVPVEVVSMLYERITWTWLDGNIETTASPSAYR